MYVLYGANGPTRAWEVSAGVDELDCTQPRARDAYSVEEKKAFASKASRSSRNERFPDHWGVADLDAREVVKRREQCAQTGQLQLEKS